VQGKELCKTINPDEAVAYGAAIQGAILGNSQSAATQSLLLVDVAPLSLGIETTGKVMSAIIKRNTPIPVRKTKQYTTEADYQDSIDVCVYEGERGCTDGNNLLGEFNITGIERAKRGVPKIDVTFELDANGILTVTACDVVTKSANKIVISNNRWVAPGPCSCVCSCALSRVCPAVDGASVGCPLIAHAVSCRWLVPLCAPSSILSSVAVCLVRTLSAWWRRPRP
jgi:molecular chaperone DnaK (HSP70)